MPALAPVTTPDVPIVATLVVTLLHTPRSAVGLLNAVVAVGHTIAVPVILPALGSGLTVTTVVAAAVPQLLVTV